jgi:putative toxin-antitoxin system antitoxin component (TIGR02293 family)
MSKKPKHYPLIEKGNGFLVAEPAVIYSGGTSPLDNILSQVSHLIGFIFPSNMTHHSESGLIPIIRKGLSKKNLDRLMDTTGLDLPTMAGILHISERTLHRYTTSTILNPEISERIIEIARLYAKGQDTFGDLNSFRTWMAYPSIAFSYAEPRAFLDTSLGIKLIEDELGRIEHGIFA